MDIATILGIFSGIGLILISIMMNSGLDLFVSYPSLMIVLGGTVAATLIAYPLNEVLRVMSLIGKVFKFKKEDPKQLIKELVEIAVKAKRQGILAIDQDLNKIKNTFLQKGLQLVVDGIEESSIASILQIEMTNMRQRHRAGWEIFTEMGKYAPAFGLIGTLIGLIQMLASLDDPGAIGPKMAVALITTFYGALLSNMIFVPMSVKLKRRSQQESQLMHIIIEAIKSIRVGENPKLMEDRLNKFLSDDESKKTNKAVAQKAPPAKVK